MRFAAGAAVAAGQEMMPSDERINVPRFMAAMEMGKMIIGRLLFHTM
jgi:hypothetical protein